MAGRPRIIRNIKSYIQNIDNHTFSGPMKMGTPPSVGKIKYYWYNYLTQCNNNPNAIKKSYANMVFLNINPAQTPVSAGFTPSSNYNYGYIPPSQQPNRTFFNYNNMNGRAINTAAYGLKNQTP